MNTQAVPVNVEQHKEPYSHDPLSVYCAAVESLGRENTFILESLSGPSRDRRATIIGMDPLFTVLVYDEFACLEASPQLFHFLHEHLTLHGFAPDASGRIPLSHREDVWALLRALRAPFSLPVQAQPSLAYFGYFSYDTIRFIEVIESHALDTTGYPVIALTVFQTLAYYHADGSREILINNTHLWDHRSLDDYAPIIDPTKHEPMHTASSPGHYALRNTVTPEQFKERVDQALHHIRIGDIYQIQLGHEVEIDTDVRPFDVYHCLRRNNPSPYMYLAHLGGVDLIGASPELFLRMRDERIEMRPIAGTAGKNNDENADEIVLKMLRSEKERAEHLMLVDLCRNDIGRVCQPGSLEMDELMAVEEYSHLYHMVSNVRGLRRAGEDAFDAIKSSFPAGTMTGAPKVRAMELIERMESNRRGIYAGAIGLVGFDDSVNTALCIRSTVHREGTYSLRASAGIVADSDPEHEWMETFYKMSSVYRAVTGEEMLP